MIIKKETPYTFRIGDHIKLYHDLYFIEFIFLNRRFRLGWFSTRMNDPRGKWLYIRNFNHVFQISIKHLAFGWMVIPAPTGEEGRE
jgi:hypothetical protein